MKIEEVKAVMRTGAPVKWNNGISDGVYRVTACCLKLTGSNTVVIIRHGEYFTVYSNLENVTVMRGDKVKTKQSIGTVHTNQTENKTELHFELLKEQNRQNPANWLSR